MTSADQDTFVKVKFVCKGVGATTSVLPTRLVSTASVKTPVKTSYAELAQPVKLSTTHLNVAAHLELLEMLLRVASLHLHAALDRFVLAVDVAKEVTVFDHVITQTVVDAAKHVGLEDVEINVFEMTCVQLVNSVNKDYVLEDVDKTRIVTKIQPVSMESVPIHVLKPHAEPTHYAESLNIDQFACVQMVTKASPVRNVDKWSATGMMTVARCKCVFREAVRIPAYNQELVEQMPNVGLSTGALSALVLLVTLETQNKNVPSMKTSV